MTAKQVGNYLLVITLQEDNMNKRMLALAAVATLGLRVCPKTSGGITKFSEHEAD